MAPRHDKTSPLTSTQVRLARASSSSLHAHTPFPDVRAFDLIRANISRELSAIPHTKRHKSLLSHSNKRKVSSNYIKYAVQESSKSTTPLTQREEIMVQGHEAMVKLKRIEVQARTREMKRTLHEQNKEIRRKRRELRRLKAIERELRHFLEQCESRSQEILVSSGSLVLKSNLNRVYMLAAALLSFLLVRIFSYSHFV